ncbi:uncharacterized protein N7506_001856 [Penicillium brevicompactum]|uniref:uncharacterized protein n=1 Tax=Penicillium brevicompactum TaxID=5074 RepID=UPI00254113D1|nr:uncharacterized protein N7506_001856 [Penicillium brevicompactum]KAJ5348603.1 hypothetical protein N7506_001856 [Penicillium brevicompactum]
MSRARLESLEKLKNWVLGRNSQITKLAQGQGIAGTRAAPSQSGQNDASIGSRLDHSEQIEIDGKDYRRYKWQINKNAANSTLKDLANKDSHKVWSEADVPVDSDTSDASDAKARVEKLFNDLKKNMKS